MEVYRQKAKEENRKKELAKQSVTQALYRKGRGMYSRYSYQKPAKKATRSDAKANLRDRLNKRYDEARNEWVEIKNENENNTTLMEEAETVAGADDDELTSYLETCNSLDDVTTLSQRLQNLEAQPICATNVFPRITDLVAKRSKRCRECQHNLIKPELSPNSIKYKMQLFASQYVPSLKLSSSEPLRVGQASKVILVVSNPLDQALTITLGEVTENEGVVHEKKSVEKESKEKDDADADADAAKDETEKKENRKALPAKSVVVCELNKLVPTAKIQLPSTPIVVAEFDPVVDLGLDENAANDFNDDPKIVHKRSGNTVHLYASVEPISEGVVQVPISLYYSYTANVPGIRSEKQAPSKETHQVKLYTLVTLGKTEGTLTDEPKGDQVSLEPEEQPKESAV
eukprot:m.38878 g.38878  ORF g.38878 m.38878 type:complete len:401 (-) comp9488_c0_seq1:65-1267(-)